MTPGFKNSLENNLPLRGPKQIPTSQTFWQLGIDFTHRHQPGKLDETESQSYCSPPAGLVKQTLSIIARSGQRLQALGNRIRGDSIRLRGFLFLYVSDCFAKHTYSRHRPRDYCFHHRSPDVNVLPSLRHMEICRWFCRSACTYLPLP